MGLESFLPQTPQGNATAAQVLTGYTFSSAAAGIGVSGTMPNQGVLNVPTNTPGSFPGGYYSRVLLQGWLTLASDTTARSDLAAAYDSNANLTYAIDGLNGAYFSTVTAYSHASNTWTTEASDTTARSSLAAAYDSSVSLTYVIDGGSSVVTGYVA